ncbi:MAG: hypothetical protein FJY54_03570 [Betaproteobacteria bacterium]|nr:hypothetical protein [Betaproteobacteria bacterium]
MNEPTRRKAARLLLLVAASFATAITSAAETPLAIRGYDPVAYFTLGAPVRGLPQFEYEWDEQRYRFSRPEHRELFRANPARYAPQFANFCTMALTRGEVYEANPEYWLISEGKLYMFRKAIGPELFRKNLAGNIAQAERNRPVLQKR